MDSGIVLSVATQVKPADLIFVRGTGPIQNAIEYISHSPYSHCAGIVKQNELIEAQGGRTTGYAALDFYTGADVFTCDALTDEQRQRIVDFVLSKIGTQYNYELIGWEFVHYVFHRDIPLSDGDCYDCSELWREAYRSVGIELCDSLEHVSPGDLAQSPLLRKVSQM